MFCSACINILTASNSFDETLEHWVMHPAGVCDTLIVGSEPLENDLHEAVVRSVEGRSMRP